MAQTERSEAEVATLLADNTTNAISPQDIRDAIASQAGYGDLILSAGGSGDFSATTNLDLITIFDTIKVQSSDVNTNGVTGTLASTYRLTVGATGIYRVGFFASFTSSQNNRLVTFRYFKNGVAENLSVSRWVSTGTDTGSAGFEDMISLAANDYVDVRVSLDTGTATLTFVGIGLNIHRVG